MKLVESMWLLPLQSKVVPMTTEQSYSLDGPILIESLSGECSTVADVQLECCLVDMNDNAPLRMLTNSSSFTHHIDKEEWTGQAIEVIPVNTDASDRNDPASFSSEQSVWVFQSDDAVQSEDATNVKTRQQLLCK